MVQAIMLWPVGISAIGLGIVLLSAYFGMDYYGPSLPGMLGILVGVIMILLPWGIFADYSAQRSSCHGYAKQTGRPTKWATYNVVSWECLTKAHDGKWIPVSQVGDYNK